jgi:hypothetical protein
MAPPHPPQQQQQHKAQLIWRPFGGDEETKKDFSYAIVSTAEFFVYKLNQKFDLSF